MVEVLREEPVRLRLSGEVDMDVAGEARQASLALINEGVNRFLVDLSDVKLMSSPGVGFVATLHHSLKSRGGRVVFVNPAPFVKEILQITGLLERITLAGTLEEAKTLLA